MTFAEARAIAAAAKERGAIRLAEEPEPTPSVGKTGNSGKLEPRSGGRATRRNAVDFPVELNKLPVMTRLMLRAVLHGADCIALAGQQEYITADGCWLLERLGQVTPANAAEASELFMLADWGAPSSEYYFNWLRALRELEEMRSGRPAAMIPLSSPSEDASGWDLSLA